LYVTLQNSQRSADVSAAHLQLTWQMMSFANASSLRIDAHDKLATVL